MDRLRMVACVGGVGVVVVVDGVGEVMAASPATTLMMMKRRSKKPVAVVRRHDGCGREVVRAASPGATAAPRWRLLDGSPAV